MRLSIIIGLLCSLGLGTIQAQTLPDITLDDIQGKQHQVSRLAQADQPTLVVFWAAWVPGSVEAVDSLQRHLEDAKLVAISIDRARSQENVLKVAEEREWKFDILMDDELALKRKLKVVNIPHVFLFDQQGKLTFQQAALDPAQLAALDKKIAQLKVEK